MASAGSPLVFGKSARDWHEPTRALRIGKGFSGPTGSESEPTGQQPDLKDSQICGGVVVFGMAHSTAGGDHLHVSRTNLPPTTRTVFVLEHAFAHVRDNLHVAMPVHRKAAVRSYLVVVPDHEVPEPSVRGVAMAIDGEVVPGLEPVAISTSQGVQSSQLQNRPLLAELALR